MEDKTMERRKAIKAIGAAAGGAAFFPQLLAATPQDTQSLGAPKTYEWKKPDRPLTAAVMGAGNRGHVYAGYALANPEELKIVGVAEPIPWRRERFAAQHGIPEKQQWTTWEHAFEAPKFCDAIIITTPDALHYGPAMAALEKNYHLILEKAIAQTWQQCQDIAKLANAKQRIVAICHVLRYTPYFRMMKHVIDSGRIGDIVSVQHLEPFGNIHMSHAFVRGNWKNSKESNPIILSKSCHDLDILRWLVGQPCRKITSFGSVSFFKKEQAPRGATLRCTDGCPLEKSCIYSAIRIYLREKIWDTSHLYIPDTKPETIREALEKGPYGKCVWHSDNDVCEHQVANMVFGDDITVSFDMEGMTSYAGRRTRIFGTKGDIQGDSTTLEVYEFDTNKKHVWDIRSANITSGHGGGDHGLARDFVQAVTRRDPSLLTSTLDASMESHLMGFKAEESRFAGGAVKDIEGLGE
jgi:predicted dehydrogenase